MPVETPQQLERALYRFRAENNRMTIRLNCYNLRRIARERAEEGLMEETRISYLLSFEVGCIFDVEMSDEDVDP